MIPLHREPGPFRELRTGTHAGPEEDRVGRDLLFVLHRNLVDAVLACDAIYTRVETKTYAVATQPLLYTLAYLLTEPRLLGR